MPKLIFSHATELELVAQGSALGSPEITVFIAGIAGLVVLVLWKSRWPVYLSLLGFSLLLIGALVWSPGYAIHVFNPITSTGAAITFCLVQLVESTRKSVEPK